MSRGKKSVVEEVKSATKGSKKLDEVYQREAHMLPTFVEQRAPFGTSYMPFKALHVPNGWEYAWPKVPTGDPTLDYDFHSKVGMEGYIIITEEFIADTLEEAREKDLFYFPVPPRPMTVAGKDAVGYPNMGHVLVVRKKEVGEKIRKRQREIALARQQAALNVKEFFEASIEEKRSTIDRLATEEMT